MSEAILITGTSTGIGFDAAREMIARGYQVFGSVRKQADGERVAAELGPAFTPLIFDVTDHDAIYAAAEVVESKLAEAPLLGIVNNAGIAVGGPWAHLPMDEIRHQFEVNFFGAVAVTQAFLPMLKRPGGRIVNISSVSGKIAFPFLGPYAGSKFALEAFSESLRRELFKDQIDVIIIGPGTTNTPIWGKQDLEGRREKYQATDYTESLDALGEMLEQSPDNSMPVERVSRAIAAALLDPRPRLRVAIPDSWLMGWFLPRFGPKRMVDRAIARALKII